MGKLTVLKIAVPLVAFAVVTVLFLSRRADMAARSEAIETALAEFDRMVESDDYSAASAIYKEFSGSDDRFNRKRLLLMAEQTRGAIAALKAERFAWAAECIGEWDRIMLAFSGRHLNHNDFAKYAVYKTHLRPQHLALIELGESLPPSYAAPFETIKLLEEPSIVAALEALPTEPGRTNPSGSGPVYSPYWVHCSAEHVTGDTLFNDFVWKTRSRSGNASYEYVEGSPTWSRKTGKGRITLHLRFNTKPYTLEPSGMRFNIPYEAILTITSKTWSGSGPWNGTMRIVSKTELEEKETASDFSVKHYYDYRYKIILDKLEKGEWDKIEQH